MGKMYSTCSYTVGDLLKIQQKYHDHIHTTFTCDVAQRHNLYKQRPDNPVHSKTVYNVLVSV